MEETSDSVRPKSAFDSPTFGDNGSIKLEQPVGSMSISPSGRDIVLASKAGLHIVDLDSPYQPPRYLPHHTYWEVADVQWSPFAHRESWVVSTSNQKALVWNLAMKAQNNSIEHVLHAHTRAITDINFSAHHPDSLATCAVDSFVHCWDLRTPARPVLTFADWFAGATQVKWNRQDSHVIASSHDKYLRIWDNRKGAYPLRSIQAHDTKIYGVDWNRVTPNEILTCSLDKTIKFWDTEKDEDKPEMVVRAPFPVWRARHTPFGWGLLAMPQRGNNDLYLYDRRKPNEDEYYETSTPVHSFPGHTDQVKEFLWRPRGSVVDGRDNREFQLVSWGNDRYLRLHKVDDTVLKSIAYEKGVSWASKLLLTRKDAEYKTFRDEPEIAKQQAEAPGQPKISLTNDSEMAGSGGAPRMGSMSVNPPGNWMDAGFHRPKATMHSKTLFHQENNPITWMKGVKIGKQGDAANGYHRRISHPFGHSADHHWHTPESLEDEITYVDDQFAKVSFESLDVQQRKATISMDGPWGAEGRSVYLRIDMKFPKEYPEKAPPSFSLEKTSSLSPEVLETIEDGLRKIAESCTPQKRGCLEPVLRFLLRERSLEESTEWLNDGEEGNVSGLAGESSSDEDDEFGSYQPQEMEMSGSGILRPANANANVPLPKACGAFWANNGKLVCFFPSRYDRPSILDNISLKDSDKRSDNIFEGFGRINANSPRLRPSLAGATIDDASSDASDESFETSSSSSGSSDILKALPSRFRPPQAWRGGSLNLQRTRSADQSQVSSSGILRVPSRTQGSTISIRSLEDLLPAKRDLAAGYRVFGKGPEVCLHNAEVARGQGNRELVDVWNLIKLLLHDEVPLEVISLAGTSDDVVLLAQRAAISLKRQDSGVDLRSSSLTPPPIALESGTYKGRVKWGRHPFASKLVPALLSHFEHLGDIQMLAMLSCVLSEPRASEDFPGNNYSHRDKELVMSRQAPAFSLDYYPSTAVAQSFLSVAEDGSVTKASLTPIGTQGSYGDPGNSDSTGPLSTGTTPPITYKLSRMDSNHSDGTFQSSSASPEFRFARRSSSNVSNVYSTSLPRPFPFAASASAASSPPTSLLKKRISPAESFNNTPAQPSKLWTTNPLFGGSGTIPEHPAPKSARQSFAESDIDRSPTRKVTSTRIKVKLKNQNLFDIDGYASIPLLDPRHEWKCRAYRAAYAHLLSVWDLPVQQREVLKFDGLPGYFTDANGGRALEQPGQHEELTLGSKRGSEIDKPPQIDSGVDILRLCPHCGIEAAGQTVQEKKSLRCRRCDTRLRSLHCAVCETVIMGSYSPCLECGHVCHQECHKDWFMNPLDDTDTVECPSGCGCHCGVNQSFKIIVPDNSSDTTAVADFGMGGYKAGSTKREIEHWDRTPFAPGVLNRSLTSKPSNSGLNWKKSGLHKVETH